MTEENSLTDKVQEFELIEGMDSTIPINEPYLGQIDKTILEFLAKLGPKYEGLKILFSHLHRTSNYNEKQTRSAWFTARHIFRLLKSVTEDPSEQIMLEQIELGAFNVILGDANKGKRANYLQTTRREYGYRDNTPKEEKKRWF